MFYSHEILTSREHGVATVWLVATLGSKSSARKVNRRAILDVDVPKACGTIIHPEAPMALRLQGNLLYGVSRVYNQQCSYALTDAQAIRDRIRTMLKVVQGNGLDPEAGKAKPEQLVLPYDPTFIPDITLPYMDIDFSKLGLSMAEAQMKNACQSSFISTPTQSTPINRLEPIELNISSSSMTPGNGVCGFGPPSDTNASAQKSGAIIEEQGFLLQPDFEFDEEGNIIELDVGATPQVENVGSETGGPSESAITGRVRRDLEEGLLAGQEMLGDQMQLDNEVPAPVMEEESSHLPGEPLLRNRAMDEDPDYMVEVQASSEAIDAPMRRKRKFPKTMEVDDPQELRNTQLAQWNAEYAQNMAVASRQKQQNKQLTIAKKNAEFWVLGKGINAVGVGLGSYEVPHPLNAFSGENLLASLSGSKKAGSGKKRGRSRMPNDDTELGIEDGRRVRPRNDRDCHITDNEDLGMNDMPVIVYDDEIEIGREAPPSLHDDHSSQMPWNITASIQGSRYGSSIIGSIDNGASLRGGRPNSNIHGYDAEGNIIPHRTSRLMSASPLAGRGSGISGRQHPSLSGPGHEEDIDVLSDTNLDNYLGTDEPAPYDSFQVHGPAADVDTQTAAQSQWLSSTLDRESLNFLDFLRAKVNEDLKGVAPSDEKGKEVSLSTLLPPETNTRVVATQAFLHVLTLATKGAVRVSQDESGEIFIQTTTG